MWEELSVAESREELTRLFWEHKSTPAGLGHEELCNLVLDNAYGGYGISEFYVSELRDINVRPSECSA